MGLLQVRTTSDHSVFLLSFVVEQEQPVSLVVVPSGIDTPKDSWFTGKHCRCGGKRRRCGRKRKWIRVVKVGIFRTKVDEKVDNSGWRIKIVADIPTKLSDIGGCPVEPFFPAAESGP